MINDKRIAPLPPEPEGDRPRIDLAELGQAAGVRFDPDAAEQLETLGRLFAIPWEKQPRKKRNHMAHDWNVQIWKQEAVRTAIQEIDAIRIENGGREPGVTDDGARDPRYDGPLVDLIDLLCEQLVVTPPSAKAMWLALRPKKPKKKKSARV